MTRWLISLILILVTPSSSLLGAPPDPAFDGWPESWIDAYRSFEEFIQAKEQYGNQFELEILEHGEKLIHDRYVKRDRGAGLQFEHTYAGRRLLDIMKPPTEYFNYAPSLTTSTVVKMGTEQGYQYAMPVVWYEVIPAPEPPPGSRNRRSKENYTFHKLPIDGNDLSYYPNNRILLFYDFNIMPGGHPWDIYGSNRRVTPSLKITINDDGVIERNELTEPTTEKLLHWIVYQDGKLIVDQPVDESLSFVPSTEMGAYVAFLCVEGPSGYLPVSNVLYYPLLPTTTGQVSLWPEDRNRNKSLDTLHLNEDAPNALSAKDRFYAQELWDVWQYDIFTFRESKPENFGWVLPEGGIDEPIRSPHSLECRTDDEENYIFTWRSEHPTGKGWIQIEEPFHSGKWVNLIAFDYADLAEPTDSNRFAITLDKTMQFISTEPVPRGTKLKKIHGKNFRVSEHRPYPQEQKTE